MNEKNISDRKKDHIELASRSRMDEWSNDKRFNYEPMLGRHDDAKEHRINFCGKELHFPIWISSMTGGTAEARSINENLARACSEFGLGMGLGSCRLLLEDAEKFIADFDIRDIIGGDLPLFANLGISQIEKAIASKGLDKVIGVVDMLRADGLVIHVNPLQEWIQSEGDEILTRPIDTIEQFLSETKIPVIVKEVGQGMGPESLERLMKLPVILEFGAYGGTNFSQLEISRKEDGGENEFSDLAHIGHNVDEMISFFNEIAEGNEVVNTPAVIISGGIKNFLDGYYALEKIKFPAIYGQASTLLKYARMSYPDLQAHLLSQIEGFNLASEFLTVREVK